MFRNIIKVALVLLVATLTSFASQHFQIPFLSYTLGGFSVFSVITILSRI